jgi:hypothetical protein
MADQKQQQESGGDWGQRENPAQTPHQHSSDAKPAKEPSEGTEELFKKPYSQKEFERDPAKHER